MCIRDRVKLVRHRKSGGFFAAKALAKRGVPLASNQICFNLLNQRGKRMAYPLGTTATYPGTGALATERTDKSTPVMVMLGSEDTVIGEAGNAAGRTYVETHAGPAYLVEIVRGGHVSFTSCELYLVAGLAAAAAPKTQVRCAEVSSSRSYPVTSEASTPSMGSCIRWNANRCISRE